MPANRLAQTVPASVSLDTADLQPGASAQSPAAKTLGVVKKVDLICCFGDSSDVRLALSCVCSMNQGRGTDLQLVVDLDQLVARYGRGIDLLHQLSVRRVPDSDKDVIGRDFFSLLGPDDRSGILLADLEVGSGNVLVTEDEVDPSLSEFLFERRGELLVGTSIDQLLRSVDEGDVFGFSASEFAQDFLDTR